MKESIVSLRRIYFSALALTASTILAFSLSPYVRAPTFSRDTGAAIFGGYFLFLLVMWMAKARLRIRIHGFIEHAILLIVYATVAIGMFVLYFYVIYLLGGSIA